MIQYKLSFTSLAHVVIIMLNIHLMLSLKSKMIGQILKSLWLNYRNFYEFSELSLRSCTSIDFELIYPPQKFPDMERFDLYRTNITAESLEFFLTYMPKLKHLNLGKSILLYFIFMILFVIIILLMFRFV